MLGCFIGVLGKRKDEERGGGGEETDGRETANEAGREEREREREGEWYRVKALSVSALRYVGTLLNPERLGEKCSTWQ